MAASTNADIIRRALRKLSQVAGGGVPEAFESAEAMTTLASMFAELIGAGTLGRLNDVLASADYTAKEWDRVQAASGVTVTLPTEITTSMVTQDILSTGWSAGIGNSWYDYGAAYSSTPRPPFNLAPVVVIDNTGAETDYFWSAYKGAWVTFSGLGEQDDFPLPKHYEDGVAAMLAERIADEYGAQVGPGTARAAASGRFMLTHRYDNARREGVAAYF